MMINMVTIHEQNLAAMNMIICRQMASDIPYTHLYRVLRPTEDPKVGITAKSPSSIWSVSQHVGSGRLSTKYISTCATESSARSFADLGIMHHDQSCPKKIITIDVEKLKVANPGVVLIDLTDYNELRTHIRVEDSKAWLWAIQRDEVLIVGTIPPSCITKVEEISGS